MKSMPLQERDKAIKSALFNARIEGFHVPEAVVVASIQILEGKVQAEDLVRQFKSRYAKL